MAHRFDMLRRQLWAVRWVALLLVPWIDGRLSGGYWLAFAYVPLLFLASPLFALASAAMTPLYLLTLHPYYHRFPMAHTELLSVSLWDYFTLLQFGLVICFARDGLLWSKSPPDRLTGFVLRRYGKAIRGLLLMASAGLTAALLFRATPVPQTAAWAVMLLYLRRHVSAEPLAPQRLVLQIATLFLFLFATLGSAAMVECLARLAMANRAPETTYYMPHPKCIWTLRPNAVGLRPVPVSAFETKEMNIRISPQGLRDRVYGPKKENEFRIAMVGDSFTYGGTTELQDTVPKTLERFLSSCGLMTKEVSVINAGVFGYGPWQEREFLLERGFPLEPDLVILQLYLTNDIENTLSKVGKKLRAYTSQELVEKLGPKTYASWPARFDRWLFNHSRVYQLFGDASGNYLWCLDIWNRIRFLPQYRYDAPPPSEPRPSNLETELRTWYPELIEGAEILLEDVLGIADDCKERGIDFMVYIVPDRSVVNDNVWEFCMRNVPRDQYERGKSIRVIQQHLDKLGLVSIDLMPLLMRH
ncbi:MAG: hypothetical protein QG656_2096, partial [Candidatus Hydrogenedentes bacterium]|nr:hypothetical protein [Candidatus Hydrogenedentota bacterium]